ncbi:MAG: hypothetical protein DHS20C15_00320 [Planctomycetota bacterium]|nr:MAG: hypothetical protein DHS20C15_00320 [Planctomycetota bacterium]
MATTKKATSKKSTPKKAAAASSAKKAPRAPKARLKLLFEKLDRAFGPLVLPETDSLLEMASALVVREGGTELTTERALKSLREDFVDWNEVRLSRPSELARLMTGTNKVSTIKRWHERAQRVREMIDQIYNDRNEPCLEFLREEKTKARFEYLEDVDDLGVHNANAMVQWMSGDEKKLILMSSEAAQAAHDLGLTSSAAVTKAKKELSALLDGMRELVSIQAHLNQLGELEKNEWPGSVKELLD